MARTWVKHRVPCLLLPLALDAQFGTPYPRSASFDTDNRHTHKHISTLIDNIAVPPSVCLVGLSHHLREATPSPIQHSTPLPPSLSLSSLSLPSYFPSSSYVWMSTDLPQDIAGSLLLNTYTSRSTSIVRPLATPPPTHSGTSSALVMSPCHTQT